jgi:hypothetical protein
MDQVMGEHVTYRVDEIEQIAINKMKAVVVAITLDFGQNQELLFGICQVRNEVAEAAARATLNAINRRLLVLKPEVASPN